jgi:hypothetical protein
VLRSWAWRWALAVFFTGTPRQRPFRSLVGRFQIAGHPLNQTHATLDDYLEWFASKSVCHEDQQAFKTTLMGPFAQDDSDDDMVSISATL